MLGKQKTWIPSPSHDKNHCQIKAIERPGVEWHKDADADAAEVRPNSIGITYIRGSFQSLNPRWKLVLGTPIVKVLRR